jgi:hypothetical protein
MEAAVIVDDQPGKPRLLNARTRSPVHRSNPRVRRNLALVAIVCGGVLAASSGAAARGTGWRVISTLDGKNVLPVRIAWIASTPGLPRSELKSGGISFLVDGKIASFTDEPPYTFPDHGGYLVTSWLKPGLHTFTVRAHAKDGTIMEDNVVARTAATPAPPAKLAGTWVRTVTDTSSAPAMGSAGNPNQTPTPAGTYTLTFDSRWIQTHFPGTYVPRASFKTGNGFIIDNDWTAGARSFEAWGGVQFKVLQDIDAEGGWWCNAGGPVAKYSWLVSGKTLTLSPVGGRDACSVRGFIWAGQWTRVS